MKFRTEIRKPFWFHQKALDSADSDPRSFLWDCIRCGTTIALDLKKRLRFSFERFPSEGFTDHEKREIEVYYALGEHSRSPCGGWLHFEKVSCPSCGCFYLFSYGVDEPSNSFLVLTVQGLVEIEEAEPGGALNEGHRAPSDKSSTPDWPS